MTEAKILEIIQEWKTFWMNQNQNSEEDRKNYFDRAFGVDANMKHDLASRIAKENASLELRLNKAVVFIKNSRCDYNWETSGSLPQGQPIHRADCRRCELIKELESTNG